MRHRRRPIRPGRQAIGFLPSSRIGAPAGLMRRPHISELMRSESSQSGPDSSSTTFLPALASTDADTEPEAPAPKIAPSGFSPAISPPLLQGDMQHVGDA